MSTTTHPPEIKLMQMLTGYWASQTLSTAARLGVLDGLPAQVGDLAHQLKLDPEALRRLLRGCTALEAVSTADGERFELTTLGRLLTSSAPGSLAGLAIMITDPGHWNSWGQLPHCVRTGKTGVLPGVQAEEIFEYYKHHPEEGSNFNRAMASMSSAWAEQLAQFYDFSGCQTIVDVGGNHGILLAAALKGAPHARGVLFDLPHVLTEADEELRRHGIFERTDKISGDFFRSVPSGDLYLLKHILHDWNDEQCTAILKSIRTAMDKSGKVLVLEMLLAAEPGMADLMDLNMLVMTGGRERTAEQYGKLLASADLKLERVIPTHGFYSILEARPT